ncbi:hypothetical protein T492DRAFT_46583 [Pavlovales sp. CCMP2436]|nr:hypothetical protein T492DRAFT_46583 [Pavlovales sp. CCMP2436]
MCGTVRGAALAFMLCLRAVSAEPGSASCRELLCPDDATVSSLVARASYAAVEGGSRPAGGCAVLLAIPPLTDELRARTIAALDAAPDFKFGNGRRQFLPELLLASYFADHPCRTPWPETSALPPAAASSAVPVLYVFALPAHALTMFRPSEAAPLLKQQWQLLEGLLASPAFARSPSCHVLLHTSTAKLRSVFGRTSRAKLESASGLIALSFEGPGGDRRLGAYSAPALRTRTIPYFIEETRLVEQALGQFERGAAPAQLLAAFARAREAAGLGARIYLRASFGKTYSKTYRAGGRGKAPAERHPREQLSVAFAHVPGADVLIHSSQLDADGPLAQQATFLATMAAMRNSTFCLVPRGITATSRRLFESLAMGYAHRLPDPPPPKNDPVRVQFCIPIPTPIPNPVPIPNPYPSPSPSHSPNLT